MLTINSTFVTKASPQHPDRNEDTYLEAEKEKVFGVFDGMGGLPGAQTAAKIASSQLETLVENIDKNSPKDARTDLKEIMQEAQNQIRKEAKNRGRKMGLGTTASVLLILPEQKKGVFVHSGDSRIYRYKKGKLEQLTQDHDLVWEAKKKGKLSSKEAKEIKNKLDQIEEGDDLDQKTRSYFEGRNIVTAGLGATKQLRLQSRTISISKGESYILSTDGIHDNLTKNQIKSSLKEKKASPAKKLLEKAGDRFSHSNLRAKPDDLTVGIIEIN